MKKNEPIKHIISDAVVTATVNDKFSEVKHKMQDACIHHMPVVSGKKLVGLLTSVDLMRSAFSELMVADDRTGDEALDHIIKIEDIMQKELITLKDSDTVRHAAEILADSNFNSLPIVNDAGELAGIITTKDLIAYLLEQY